MLEGENEFPELVIVYTVQKPVKLSDNNRIESKMFIFML